MKEYKKGDILYKIFTSGAFYYTVEKIEIVSIRKIKGEIYSYRYKILESIHREGYKNYREHNLLRTLRIDLINLKTYQIFENKKDLDNQLNTIFENMYKVIDILKQDYKMIA